MKAVIIGGGKGCKAILEMIVQGRLEVLSPEIMCVVDPNPNAPGMLFARDQGWKTLLSMEEALRLPGLEFVIELTGSERVLKELYSLVPPGMRIMDHVLARVFWDMYTLMDQAKSELDQKTEFETQLRKDRRELQQILDSLPDTILVVDSSHNIERTNARFLDLAGCTEDDLKNKSCPDPFCRKHRGGESPEDKGICVFEQVEQTGEVVNLIQYEPGNGVQEGYYEITATPVFDEDGQIVKMVKTARQVTEQIMLKRETEEREYRFRQFIENAHDMITIKDLSGRYLVINPPAAALFGRRPEEFLGRTDFEIFPARLAEALTGKDREVLARRAYSSSEEHLVVNGRKSYLNTVRFPLLDYKGDVSGVCSISRDVTEQARLQEAMVQSEKLAAVGKLAAGVAHELNNPLTGILTFTEELKLETPPEDPISKDLDTIIHETMRCRQIVRDLLDYSRLERPQRRSMNLNRVIERSLSLVQKQAAFHDIDFELSLREGIPEIKLDPNQMQQVFLNLIINAAEAMNNSGRIKIFTDILEGGRLVEATVEDEGHGIAPDMIQQIFEPFYSTKGQQGNGLGLAAVQSIVDQHGGRVAVESEVGVGSRFHIILPLSGEEKRREAHG